MGKHKNSNQIKGFLHISHKANIHKIPKSWDEWSPIFQSKCWKLQWKAVSFIQPVDFWENLKLLRKPTHYSEVYLKA